MSALNCHLGALVFGLFPRKARQIWAVSLRLFRDLKSQEEFCVAVWEALHWGEFFPLRDDRRAAMRSLLLCAAVLFDQERILSIRLTTSIRIGSGWH